MYLSKLTFFSTHLKTLTKPLTHHHHHRHVTPLLSIRCLSYATPEEAAAARRQRKRTLRIEPPLNSIRPQRRPQNPISKNPNPNPNAPKLPEHVSALKGKRLDLHNKILTLIRENDLDEAALYTRHSIYSNCKPTIFTCNAVMAALLRQSRYSDMLSLHRFVTQAGVAANVVTHNLLINAYCDCRKTDTALEHYKQLINNAPFDPSPTTYRILVKGLVDNLKVDRAVELKDEMLEKGLAADPVVYNYLILGLVKNEDGDRALALYEELKGKLDFVNDGIVYGNLMKAYFLKGLDKEAMEIYADLSGEGSSIKMNALAYNSVLQALIKNGKSDEALQLFERMKEEHSPPRKLTVNLGSYNVMVDWFCEQGKFDDAIEVFRKMGEKRSSPDTLSFNNLIQQLCANDLMPKAEELYREMGEIPGANPDEYTYVLLIDTCFEQSRADDAAEYFGKMVESGLKPNLATYNKVVDGLIKAGKIDEANGFFSQMIVKLRLDAANFEVMLRALCEAAKLDEVLKLVSEMLKDEKVGLNSEMDEFVRDALRKEGREGDLVKLLEDKEREEREKAEALAKKAAEEAEAEAAKAAKASALAAGGTYSLFGDTKPSNGNVSPLSLFGDTKTSNSDVPSAETFSMNGEAPSGNQEGSGGAPAVEATPALGVVEETIDASDLDKELNIKGDGMMEETTEASDTDEESSIKGDGVVEEIIV